jgi:CotH kinase protein/Secretion system C-terminal sorting domain
MFPRITFSVFLICFVACPTAHSQILTSSDIPIVVINTVNAQPVLDDPKIMADMGIIYNGVGNRNFMTDPFNNYNGKIGIEIRGSSSQQFHPKKSYGIECWDSLGTAINLPILGMPAESDWCLIANYIDKSLSNNALTYSTWSAMGWWGPRCMEVELVLNGVYKGVYLFTEKIKRDVNRVDIANLQTIDTTGDELTGGYILKIDQYTGTQDYGWYSAYESYGTMATGQYPYYVCVYPDSNSIRPQQAAYITAYVDSFETALENHQFDPVTGWQKYGDINSFVDYFLIQEMSKNVDGYRASTYFYKDKNSNGGKLTMGLVWDYDRGWDNASYANGWLETGFDWSLGDFYYSVWTVPSWWEHMMQDTNFTKAVRCRWEQLKYTTLGVSSLHAFADSMFYHLYESQQRNFYAWPIIGVLVFPNPAPVPSSFQGEIDELKTWIYDRWNWLDANIPGTAVNCSFVGIPTSTVSSEILVSPNPFTDQIQIQLPEHHQESVQITIHDLTGRIIFSKEILPDSGETMVSIDPCILASGVYLLTLDFTDTQQSVKIVRQ